ncbi:DUF3800 domain-containing protein [Halorussus halobius]|uniref:DUF3800 domain-containing protein n=1 Tax=Halorussus halobius TaxID=1710537 RepID=UPI001091F6B4|nr:DUF3800 domain-containing protein [Halorussus halobius]
MTTLYICVDESGRKATDDCYTVAGCWFLSEWSNPHDVLMATKDRLLDTVQSIKGYERQPSEIKSAKLDPDTLGTVVDRLQSEVYDDDSLVTAENNLPWTMSFPVGFTIAPLHGRVCRTVLDDHLSRLSAFEAMQVMGLSSVLAPLTNRRALLDDESYDGIRVLLDATTWENAANVVRGALNVDSISFSIRDSKSTPGIQFGDVAAYSWRRNLTRADCGTAAGLLHDLRFAR